MKYVIEIGGKSKTFAQFKKIPDRYEKIIAAYPYAKRDHGIPLFTFGFPD